MKQLLSSIEYLRRKGILLNRLFLDNILINERERGDIQVKLFELNTVPMDPEDEADCEDTFFAGTIFYQLISGELLQKGQRATIDQAKLHGLSESAKILLLKMYRWKQ